MIKIDKARAIELFEQVITEAVAERGADAGYEFPAGKGGGCLYVHRIRENGEIQIFENDGEPCSYKPGCIIGQALIKAGVPIEKLTWSFEGSFGYDSISFLADHDVEVTHEARMFMRSVQAKQDRGMPWAESLAMTLAGERY